VADHEVTLGEVYRLAERIDKRLDAITKEMVGRDAYEADKRATERRFKDAENDHAELKATVAAVDAKVDSKVKALETSIAGAEKERQQERSRRGFVLFMAVASPVIAVVVSILFNGGA
jgi:predicted nucleotidyltransferase component of viral defense system